MMIKIIAFLLLISNVIFSQEILKGNILDFETKQPISGANIFISSTTFSTISNTEGYFTINASQSNSEVIIRYLGYETARIDLKAIKEFSSVKTIYLNKTSKNLEEVKISMAKPKDQKGALKIFKDYFIGKSQLASKAEILNEKDIQFRMSKSDDEDSGAINLIAFSDSPIQIVNKKLGYQINYELVDFEYNRDITNDNSFSYYKGYSQFIDIIDEYKLDRNDILENRKKAYYGSSMHFIRSVFLKNYEEEGFTVKNFTRELNPNYQNRNIQRDSLHSFYSKYVTTFSKNISPNNLVVVEGNKTFITFENYISVVYSKMKEDYNYAEAYGKERAKYQTSEIRLKDSKIEILPDGNYTDNEKIIFYKYMSWGKIGDSLPLNYEP